MEEIKLTRFGRGSGCGCKIASNELKSLLESSVPKINDSNLLVGNQYNDDASVYAINNNTAIISTTDFFTPIVNQAFDFGRVAACNAISDVYAMGGKPIMALAILSWPLNKIPASYAAQVLEGARHVCYEAGINLCGGHSIDSDEPLFGLAVTGIVDIDKIKRNHSAREGDYLYLSKPLGLGVYSAALKREIIKPEDEQNMIDIMTTLNKLGEALGHLKGVNALTDVTGFGLMGHLSEMLIGSNLSAQLKLEDIPMIKNIEYYTNQFCYPNITTTNFNACKNQVEGLNGMEFLLLCDPQTSGGLLISVAEEDLPAFKEITREYDKFGCLSKPIGRIIPKSKKLIYLE